MVLAREERLTDSFFLMARAASVGPLLCSLMTSIRSTIPLRSSTSYSGLVMRSIWTVIAVYGFACRKRDISTALNL